MATKAQVQELEDRIKELQWQMEEMNKLHESELKKLKDEYELRLKQALDDARPATIGEVKEMILNAISNLSITANADYGGYVDVKLEYDDKVISSSDCTVRTYPNPLDE